MGGRERAGGREKGRGGGRAEGRGGSGERGDRGSAERERERGSAVVTCISTMSRKSMSIAHSFNDISRRSHSKRASCSERAREFSDADSDIGVRSGLKTGPPAPAVALDVSGPPRGLPKAKALLPGKRPLGPWPRPCADKRCVCVRREWCVWCGVCGVVCVVWCVVWCVCVVCGVRCV